MPEKSYHCCETQTGEKIINSMPDGGIVDRLAMFFRVFGDSGRLRILHCLYDHELCVHDIARLIDSSQSAVSHQLSMLKRENLIKSRRDGKFIYYSLNDDHVRMIYETGLEHIKHLF